MSAGSTGLLPHRSGSSNQVKDRGTFIHNTFDRYSYSVIEMTNPRERLALSMYTFLQKMTHILEGVGTEEVEVRVPMNLLADNDSNSYCSSCENDLVGVIDAVRLVQGGLLVEELKTFNVAPRKFLYKAHADQIQVYAHLLNIYLANIATITATAIASVDKQSPLSDIVLTAIQPYTCPDDIRDALLYMLPARGLRVKKANVVYIHQAAAQRALITGEPGLWTRVRTIPLGRSASATMGRLLKARWRKRHSCSANGVAQNTVSKLCAPFIQLDC